MLVVVILLAFGVLSAGDYVVSITNAYTFANGLGYDLTISSEDIVAGCMDQYADNYNADANIEGEECLYPCEGVLVNLDIAAVAYRELYWELVSDSGLIIAMEVLTMRIILLILSHYVYKKVLLYYEFL